MIYTILVLIGRAIMIAALVYLITDNILEAFETKAKR